MFLRELYCTRLVQFHLVRLMEIHGPWMAVFMVNSHMETRVIDLADANAFADRRRLLNCPCCAPQPTPIRHCVNREFLNAILSAAAN